MEEGPCCISSLPQDVLLHIASLIPLKEAIRTSILSNEWRSLWRPVQVKLEFDSTQLPCFEAREKLKQIIGALLKSYDYPERLKLYLESRDCTKEKAGYSKISDELLVAVTKGTHAELYFDFPERKKATSKFNLILDQPGSLSCPSFSSLKSLQLRFVNHIVQHLVTDLFSSCKFLESLSLEKCSGPHNIDLNANGCFKSLTVVDCLDLLKIKISAPSLITFSYRGILPSIELSNTPHLVDVVLNLRDGLGQNSFDCEDVLSLLSSLKDVETLTISGWLHEWLCTSGVIFERLDFKFNMLKELSIDSVMDKSKRDSLACFLNMTPNLEKLFVKIDPKCSEIPSPFLHSYWHEPHLWMDYATVKCNASPLKHLKIIKLVGFTCSEDELLFMDLLLHKAVNLNNMVIVSLENGTTWNVAVIPSSQTDHILRRQQKGFLVPSPNNYSFYLLTEAKE